MTGDMRVTGTLPTLHFLVTCFFFFKVSFKKFGFGNDSSHYSSIRG